MPALTPPAAGADSSASVAAAATAAAAAARPLESPAAAPAPAAAGEATAEAAGGAAAVARAGGGSPGLAAPGEGGRRARPQRRARRWLAAASPPPPSAGPSTAATTTKAKGRGCPQFPNCPAPVGAADVFRGRLRGRRNSSGRRQRSLQGEVAGQSAAGHSVSAREGDYWYYVHESMTPCRACTPLLGPSTVLAYPAGNNLSTFHERIVKDWGKDL